MRQLSEYEPHGPIISPIQRVPRLQSLNDHLLHLVVVLLGDIHLPLRPETEVLRSFIMVFWSSFDIRHRRI